ncbi:MULTISPECIES: 2Fe-2S iron-sulfur cluster-binding protein [unclassified Cupriavidus]|jgi:isoquinoline 1-oxidoreductase alpha subunit|uniref:(2Fe-2S)-binding protein n=1 Tax=unclassified Cupriavidus TaxID=2640874 RepID=UPI001BFFE390|nr:MULTISPECIES: 2Fe-2S iron-sulfur cluster-binding protein [unclassified Cupriavidus]MCA3184985.1 2Fe-2S iron-sulfur cluster binding domain-containing protein [Cupriavidus sp.]MCA3193748.1 2Fe-2S iron-sulfur cluster binding domain-containing protein [Cupriavidus sp.]MCA3196279.1 2Fe-2S iron-sulfur cluster binding domain-containing protein [Cupriavidus sp.]MCA3203800.1 2Fe-2S iron-sulfur cluster binding domain-containing protein [Cupriavidus sp.]MCA3207844.1 2Fe-2S iron-sulfur cluster binding 
MVSVRLNGKTVDLKSAPDTPLLWALRCEQRLTGTKFGCGIGVCGACTVLLDNRATPSCQLPLKDLRGARITTIEGLQGPVARALRAAWIEFDVVQCGYCQSAQLIAAAALLTRCVAPTEAQIDTAMRDIACRCGTFPRIRKAIHKAAAVCRRG